MAIKSIDYLKEKFENFDRPNGSDFTDLIDSCYIGLSSLSGVFYGNLTIFGDVSASGYLYGDGSRLSGIISGDNTASTVVKSNSANWNASYTLLQSNSSFWDIAYNISTDFKETSSFFATKTLLNSTSSILLEKSIYQSASSNFEKAYNISTEYSSTSSSFATKTLLNSVSSSLLEKSIYQSASSNFVSTESGVGAITKIISVSAIPITQEMGTLYILI